ncbi:MAG: OmpA family protein [Bacteroidia bacterium]|nr:OmpA family protein [Bacteroidia bacterium]
MTFLFKSSVGFKVIFVLITLFMTNTLVAQSQPQKNYYIKSVFFGGGSYYIDQEQEHELIEFILEIEDLREYEIEIHGHTDNIGSVSYNQWLSEMRSFEVLDIISELELNKTGIQVHDFGELSPYYDNHTWEGKLSNRRVDVIIRKITM